MGKMKNTMLILALGAGAALGSGAPSAPDGRSYLPAVIRFVETMMERGTDRYGPRPSPLFAGMLNLRTLSLPVTEVPPEFYRSPNRQVQSIGCGLPDPPVGIRPGDRVPFGNNLEHDILLLRTMFELTRLTGEPRYARRADEVLRFWLENCQSAETGLMACGEHASWDFLQEKIHADVHEVFRRFPFWENLYQINPYRALRIAEGIWMSQVADRRRGDYNRHAGLKVHHPSLGAASGSAFPRHSGFYIWTFANAFLESRDPRFIERIEVLVESRTGLRPRPYSLLVPSPCPPPSDPADPTLRLLLWDSSALVPEKTEAWRQLVRTLDERDLAARAPEESDIPSRPRAVAFPSPKTEEEKELARKYAGLAKGSRVLVVSGGVRTISTSLSPLWEMSYGGSGLSGKALLDYTRFRQTGDARFLARARRIADALVRDGLPDKKDDLWPKACGQVISLLVSLRKEVPERSGAYLEFARQTADMAIGLFQRNGLFRADGSAEHYEAITGADDLLWGLLQLHCALEGVSPEPTHNDVNW